MSTNIEENELYEPSFGKRENVITSCQRKSFENAILSFKSPSKGSKDINTEVDHENQVSLGGDSDLHKHKKNCKKNPGHLDFIPIESFSLKHLPEVHQDIDLYEYIKATASFTVKIIVRMTSPDRPEFWPNTKIPYFLSDLRGKKTLRTGSGRVWRVERFTSEDKNLKYSSTTCQCDKCTTSEKPNRLWWKIKVVTAAHVVVDDIEASHTTLRLFYVIEDSVMVILKDKVCVYFVDIEKDRCLLSCVTCDVHLGNKLEKIKEHFDAIGKCTQNMDITVD